jgi:CheY-like chemotaxis protein
LAAVDAGDYGAAILDLHLGDCDGIELAHRLMAMSPRLAGHIALMTGDLDPGQLARASGLPVLAKPFRLTAVEQLAMTFL